MEMEKVEVTRIDLADRVNAISDELVGISRILFIMYEYEMRNGGGAEQFIPLASLIGGFGRELKDIANKM